MGLAVEDHRIDGEANVIDAVPTDDANDAGVRVDLDLADMGAGRPGTDFHHLIGGGVERTAQFFGQIVAGRRRLRDIEDADMFVGAADRELAVDEIDIGRRCLENMRGDLLAFLDDFVAAKTDDETRKTHRTAGMRSPAGFDARGIVRDVIDAFMRHTEPGGQKLREAGFVTLAAVHRAEHEFDPAFGFHRDLGAFARETAGDLDVIADADATQLAARL